MKVTIVVDTDSKENVEKVRTAVSRLVGDLDWRGPTNTAVHTEGLNFREVQHEG